MHLLFHERNAPEALLRDAALLADIRHACCAAGRLRRHDRSRYQLGRLMLPKLTGTLSCLQSRKRRNNGDMMMLLWLAALGNCKFCCRRKEFMLATCTVTA